MSETRGVFHCGELGFLLNLKKTGFKAQIGSPTYFSSSWFVRIFDLANCSLETFKTGKKARINIFHFSAGFFGAFFVWVGFLGVFLCPNDCFSLLPSNKCELRAKRRSD